MSEPIGLFGGTFDPIHYGHLRTSFELWQALRLAQVRFLPTGSPPHRETLLRRGFRYVGVGVAAGSFSGFGGANVATADFSGG